jgi:hypothetical protein
MNLIKKLCLISVITLTVPLISYAAEHVAPPPPPPDARDVPPPPGAERLFNDPEIQHFIRRATKKELKELKRALEAEQKREEQRRPGHEKSHKIQQDRHIS